MSTPRWVKSPATPSVALSLVAAGLLVYHVFCDPTRKFDGWAVALLVIVFLPWLGSIFETIEFPGGGKVEWRKRVEDEQQRQAAEIEGLQLLLATLLTDEERALLQQLANDEPIELEHNDIPQINLRLQSLRRLALIAEKASFVRLKEELTKTGGSLPMPGLNEMFEVTDRGQKYLELSKDLPDVEPLPINPDFGSST
jgi:hypothetical protein